MMSESLKTNSALTELWLDSDEKIRCFCEDMILKSLIVWLIQILFL